MKRFFLLNYKILLISLLTTTPLMAQNWGFEGGSASPPTTWTIVTGTWITNTNPTYVRTGTQSMGITGPVTTGTTIYNTSASVTVPTSSTHYLITIAWAKASDPNNGVGYIGYRGTATTLNPSVATAGQPANMNNTTFSRIVSVSTATVAAGSYGPAIRAFQTAAATPSTTVYTDDFFVYASTSNIPDTVSPNKVSSVSVTPGTPYVINWTNGTDTAVNSSGKGGVVILRTNGSVGLPPRLNSQAMYNPAGGVAGVASFVQTGITWNVVADITDSTISTYNDASAIFPGPYTYAVVMRDRAYNYSDAAILPPSAGTPMAFFSSTVTQTPVNAIAGRTNVPAIRMEVEVTGDQSPLIATSFSLSTNGTLNPAELTRARVYSTGYSPTFDSSSATLFGSFTSPSGAFTITGSKALSIGTNYFWLTYDITNTVTNCNPADAECNSITIASVPRVPSVTAPSGELTLRAKLAGSYTIDPSIPTGCSNGNFQTFTEAVNYLNDYGINGNVIFNVAAGSIFKENPLIINTTGTSTSTITFQKNGVGTNPVIYGINGTGTLDAVIALNGVDYYTFNGIDVSDSISNATTNTQMEYGYGIVNSSATRGSRNNTIKNTKITLRRSNTATIGIAQSTLTVASSATGGNHNNRYENVRVENSYGGILLQGTPAFPDSNNIITSSGTDTTCIGSASVTGDIGAGTVVVTGINLVEQKNISVSNCIVRNLSTASTGYSHGIWLNNTTAATNYGNAKIFNNLLYSFIRTTAGSAAASAIIGIRIDVAALGTAQVYNNVIHSITSNNTAHTSGSVTVRGIAHGITVLTGSAEFYHNSVNLNNTNTFAAIAGFTKAATAQAILRNNIFSVTSIAQTANPKHYAAYINVTTPNVISSNNVLWSSPTTNGFVGYAGSTLADRASLTAFAAAISGAAPSDGNELGSAFVNPNFTSTSDLTFAGATAAALSGVPITSLAIPNDITGSLRSSITPTIGAYETTQPLFDSAAPVISNIIIKNGAAPYVYATIKDNSLTTPFAGNIQLWYRLGTTGIFASAVPDSVPAGNMNGTYKWAASLGSLTAGSYQFYIVARDQVAMGSNIGVNPAPTVAFTSFATSDPANYVSNPDASVNTRTFSKLNTLAGGTYTIGPSGTYPKLTDAANALNTGDLTGNIILQMQATYDGTTGETFPITFNQFATTGGNWSVTIRPAAGASALQVKGSNATTLIDLNGTKRLTIDGRPGGTGTTQQLSITNTSTAGIAVRLINDAQNDTLRYLNIADSNMSVTGGAIVFSTTNVTSGANGNSNNMIDFCNINCNSISANGIYSSGSASPADNKNNTVTNCNIFDFFSNTVATVNGILLAAGNSSWTIGTTGNGNRFYQTAVRNSTSTPVLNTAVGFRAIQINDANTGGCSIVGNTIGGNISGIPGSVFSIGDNVGTAYVGSYIRAIDIVAASTTVPTSIQGNTISNMTLYTSISAGFAGIHVLAGQVNTGNTAGNTIGSATGTGSINVFYKNTTTGVNLYGIRYSGASGGLIQNNTIGSITNEAGAGSDQLLCIYGSGTFSAPLTISNNLIGSLTTANSIQTTASSAAPVNIMGIVMSAATGVAITISNNTVMNLSTLYTGAATTNGLKGIYITGASSVSTTVSGNIVRKLYSESTNPSTDQSSAIVGINSTTTGAGPQTISGNTVSALVSGSITGAVNVVGIYYASTTTGTPNRIERNLIHSLSASPSNATALVSGITQGAGTARLIIANNMIQLGLDSLGAPATGPHFITGIQKTTGSENVTIFNTVRIVGTNISNGVANSYAYRSAGVGVDTLINNIFINTRTNATTGGVHYAIGLGATTTLRINYNLYNAGGVLGQLASVDQAAISNWRTATGQDANSVSTTANFVSNTDLHLTGASIGNFTLAGVPAAGFTTDFDGQTRSIYFPYMGADENTGSPLMPVDLTAFSAQKQKDDVQLNWITASENNSSHFTIERSTDGKTFDPIEKVKAAGNSAFVNKYSYLDKDAFKAGSVLYYRLQMTDNDGSFEYSETRVVNGDESSMTEVAVYPNPFADELFVTFNSASAKPVELLIQDITGKNIQHLMLQSTSGINKLPVDAGDLKAGIYFVVLKNEGQQQTIKVIKN
jgi:hypothetical protein